MWIGRWWAGFLLISIVMFAPSLTLYLYPTLVKNKSGASIQKSNYDNVSFRSGKLKGLQKNLI